MFCKKIILPSLIILSLFLFSLSTSAKTLIYCVEASPTYLSGPLADSVTDRDVTAQIFDRLVEFEPGSMKIIPGLAESWSVSPDGLIYTFKLRQGVKFHSTKEFEPTRYFNADDVVFSFARQFKKDHPYHKVSGGVYVNFDGLGLNKIIKEVKKIDDETVQFKLRQSESPFLLDLAITNFGSIMSAEFADQMLQTGTPEKIDLVPIGTGPFILTEYQKDSLLRFQANPHYWRGKPEIDNLIFSITTDPSKRLIKLEKGDCHILPYSHLVEIKKIRHNPHIVLLEQEGTNVGFLTFNTQKKPLNDVRVRKALSMAVNKQAIIDVVFKKHGLKAVNPLPPTLWGYNNNIKDMPYNPEQAKKILAEAGYSNGFEIDLWALPISQPYNGKHTAELIQLDWSKIGVKANIITYEWSEYIKLGQAGEAEAYMMGWQGQNGDPDNFLHTLFSCHSIKAKRNSSFWCHEAFDALVTLAKKTNDLKKRTQLYEHAQRIFHKELPALPLVYSKSILPIRREVKGYKQHPLGYNYFYNVDIEDSE